MAKQVMCAKHPKDPCWVCIKPPVKYAVSHHVMGAAVDPDLTVDLCRGCHMLEKYLSQRKFLDNPAAVGRLITLARFHAGLPDARTFIYYETEQDKADMINYLSGFIEGKLEIISEEAALNLAKDIYEIVYPHTKDKEENKCLHNGKKQKQHKQ